MPFFFINANSTSWNTWLVYLKVSARKLSACRSKLLAINWKLSINTRCLPNIKAMYFPMLLGILFISRSYSFPMKPISCVIKWKSYPRRLWKTTGSLKSLGLTRSLRLQSWWADPLYLPAMWQWSLTRISFSAFVNFWPHIWHSTEALKSCSSSSLITNGFLN